MRTSLIATTFNDIKTVSQWIDSLAPQVNEETEFVIIDANSDDGTWQVIERYAKDDLNVTAVQVVRGSGRITRGEGRHLGALLSKGEVLIHALDADVIYRAGAIRTIMEEFDRDGTPVAGDSYFAILRNHYFLAGGYSGLQVNEDFTFYDAIKKAGIPFRAKRTNCWAFDFNDQRPLRNLAKMGTDEDRTEAIR